MVFYGKKTYVLAGTLLLRIIRMEYVRFRKYDRLLHKSTRIIRTDTAAQMGIGLFVICTILIHNLKLKWFETDNNGEDRH